MSNDVNIINYNQSLADDHQDDNNHNKNITNGINQQIIYEINVNDNQGKNIMDINEINFGTSNNQKTVANLKDENTNNHADSHITTNCVNNQNHVAESQNDTVDIKDQETHKDEEINDKIREEDNLNDQENNKSEEENQKNEEENDKNEEENHKEKQQKKRLKNVMNYHDLSSILVGKRERTLVDKSIKATKSLKMTRHKKAHHNHHHQKSKDKSRKNNLTSHNTKESKLDKVKTTKLNKIFYKSIQSDDNIIINNNNNSNNTKLSNRLSNNTRLAPLYNNSNHYHHPDEDMLVNTKELFENIYVKIKKKMKLNDSDNNIEIQPKHIILYEKYTSDINLNPLYLNKNYYDCTKQNKHDNNHNHQQELSQNISHNHLPFSQNINGMIMKEYPAYISCDPRYFNFDYITEKIGYFDVILMNPPWSDTNQNFHENFSNDKDNNAYDDYETLSNTEISNLKIDKLSNKGFIFIWIHQSKLSTVYEIITKWGYEIVDQIIWVKLKKGQLHLKNGDFFLQSFEMCLVGYKCPAGEYVEYNSKISNNLIFSESRKNNQKPNEIYEIIELMMPGARKIEIFATNESLRPGWFALGNKLGEQYGKWVTRVECNECQLIINPNTKRYKSKKTANHDVCEKCFISQKLQLEDFYEFENKNNEEIYHYYFTCSECNIHPIMGPRFQCKICLDYNICEYCYDQNFQNPDISHNMSHGFEAIEYPLKIPTFAIHHEKRFFL